MTVSPPGAPRVLFYVQHLLGIGHLARASLIASRLVADGFDVSLVTGGLAVKGFPPPGVRHLALPAIAIGSDGFSDLVDDGGRPVDDAFKARRRDLLLDHVRAFRPDVVITEAFPFGRRQVRFELLPLIDALAAIRPRPLLFASVRDILQANRKAGRDEETVALVNAAYDGVLVHGDPAFVAFGETFPLAGGIRVPVHHTGLVAAPPPAPSSERYEVVVSVGGGAVGITVLAAALDAHRRLAPALPWCLITGPNLPADERARLEADRPDGVRIERFRTDFRSLLASADVSVSQAGYNTACDVLAAGCRAVLVPFAAGGETEQGERAARLVAIGRAGVVAEAGLTGAELADAIAGELARPRPSPSAFDLDGAAGTARVLRQRLAVRA